MEKIGTITKGGLHCHSAGADATCEFSMEKCSEKCSRFNRK